MLWPTNAATARGLKLVIAKLSEMNSQPWPVSTHGLSIDVVSVFDDLGFKVLWAPLVSEQQSRQIRNFLKGLQNCPCHLLIFSLGFACCEVFSDFLLCCWTSNFGAGVNSNWLTGFRARKKKRTLGWYSGLICVRRLWFTIASSALRRLYTRRNGLNSTLTRSRQPRVYDNHWEGLLSLGRFAV